MKALARTGYVAAAVLWLGIGAAAAHAQSSISPAGPATALRTGQHDVMPRINPPSTTDWAAVNRANKPLDDARQRADKLIEEGKLIEAERVLLDAIAAARHKPLAMPVFLLPTLGEIYLGEDRNRDALSTFLDCSSKGGRGPELDLDICIAFCRLGDYRSALPYYAEATKLASYIWEYDLVGQAPRPQDWPGTASPAALQASALLARGISKQSPDHFEDALRDFQAADRLAPGNPLIAYHAATMLDDLKRFKEALPYYRRAAYSGNRFVAEQSRRKVASLQAWLAQPHPKTKEPEGE